jgi:hypothetical protein
MLETEALKRRRSIVENQGAEEMYAKLQMKRRASLLGVIASDDDPLRALKRIGKGRSKTSDEEGEEEERVKAVEIAKMRESDDCIALWEALPAPVPALVASTATSITRLKSAPLHSKALNTVCVDTPAVSAISRTDACA